MFPPTSVSCRPEKPAAVLRNESTQLRTPEYRTGKRSFSG